MNVVGTVLLTGVENPMCPGCDNYPADVEILRDWLESLKGCSAMVLEDELGRDGWVQANEIASVPVSFMSTMPTTENLFFQRWRLHREWLRGAIQTEYVWLTDGSDVRMLNPPWEHMNVMDLYLGSEEDTLSNPWILNNHPSLDVVDAVGGDLPLLNAGLLGGHRLIVLSFLDLLLNRVDRGPEVYAGDMTDMGAFNLTAYVDWPKFVAGYPVHTKFNSWVKSDPKAWWAHK